MSEIIMSRCNLQNVSIQSRRIPIRCAGISILELVVTLFIVSILLASVTMVMYQTTEQIAYIDGGMEQQAILQNCLDLLMDDITRYSAGNMTLAVEQQTYSEGDLAHLIIRQKSEQNPSQATQVDWISVLRTEEEDLLLCRRETQPGVSEKAVYIPLCDNLSSFAVSLLDDKGEPTEEKDKIRVVEVQASVFRDDRRDPERVNPVSRTFCVQRFQQ